MKWPGQEYDNHDHISKNWFDWIREQTQGYKDGNNQKRRLRDFEIDKIVDTFLNKEAVDDFSVAVTYDEIKEKKYSLAAGQYFDVKIEYVELSQDEFNARMSAYAEKLQEYFVEGDKLKTEIMEQLKKVKYE